MSVTSWVSDAPTRLRERMSHGIREAAGLSREAPRRCEDPELAYQRMDGVARVIHGDLPSMMIGGLASLFFEMLHPHTMAGVAQHSRYRDDPLGRVLRTANFIGVTTYGTTDQAERAIERVRGIHQRVRGVADDGRVYCATDPHLLSWVHCAGTSMFLKGYQRFGARDLTSLDADRYVAEQSGVALALGVLDPPRTVAQLHDAIEAFRPELRLSSDGVVARDFVDRGVVTGPHRRLAHRLLVDSAYALLDGWALELLGVSPRPLRDRLVVRPATSLLASAVRQAIPPTKPVSSRSSSRRRPRRPGR